MDRSSLAINLARRPKLNDIRRASRSQEAFGVVLRIMPSATQYRALRIARVRPSDLAIPTPRDPYHGLYFQMDLLDPRESLRITLNLFVKSGPFTISPSIRPARQNLERRQDDDLQLLLSNGGREHVA